MISHALGSVSILKLPNLNCGHLLQQLWGLFFRPKPWAAQPSFAALAMYAVGQA